MTDRELLESAARAAGLQLWAHEDGGLYLPDPMRRWNPIEDDGDALRLAVKLGIDLQFACKATWIQFEDDSGLNLLHEPHGINPEATTRRAIVRAAAAIGEKVK